MLYKSDVLSRISHEIRTPLNSIMGLNRIVAEKADDPAAVKEYTKQIDVASAYILALVNNILDAEQFAEGTVTLAQSDFSIRQMVEVLQVTYSNAAKQEGIDFSFVMPEPMPETVTGDRYRLNQVLGNLLSNAIRFNKPEGRVDFLVEDMGACNDTQHIFRFTVADTGIGMGPDKLKNLFAAKVVTDDETAVYGAGFGLAVAQNVVGLMGGKINVRSIEGQGSTFWFEVPMTVPEAKPRQVSEENADLQGCTVLIADDNTINIGIVKHLLKSYGCNVEVATNGKDAVALFKASEPGHYDAVLLDIRMPVMDGLEAARQIRALGGEGGYSYDALTVPIIAMTANAMDSDREKSLEAGMNAHLTKPIQPEELYTTLASLKRQ
ncbi:MAG: response regulator [Treponemataceae bacterium]|nr:response regulator [Treponemataceae bacterium]